MKKELRGKNSLKDALVILLKRKSFDKITVVELCEQANVNRSTFYAYYIDKFDILRELHYDLISQTGEIVKKHWKNFQRIEDDDSLMTTIVRIVEILKENKELYLLYVNNPNDNQFEINLLKYYKEKMDSKDYKLIYHTIGCFAMMISWIENGCKESCEEMARIIYEQSKVYRE